MSNPDAGREQLLTEIDALRARLDTAKQRLRELGAERMEAAVRLAGGVAHEFNNLLTVITGYGNLLLTQLPPGEPARELARELQKAAERAAALTRQLLAFGCRQPTTPVVFDLNALVADAEKKLGTLFGEKVELMTALDPRLGRVRADRGQVEQVLLNLALHARDRLAEGGRLVLETHNADVDATGEAADPEARPGSYAMLAVRDSGGGMDEATRARVFEPFFPTPHKSRGSGLALAAAYGTVKQSGGHIAVDSAPGTGTTFRVYLPRVEDAPVVAAPGGGETVLLVEDEEAVLGLARLVLQTEGYTVLPAQSAEEALTVCARHSGSLDLLVTDVAMPQMSGCELADRLGRERPGLKVLYLSGFVNETILQHGLRGGTAGFLPKPFTPSLLAQKVREVLGQGAGGKREANGP